MSCENPRLAVGIGLRLGMVVGLCSLALLLLGCRSSQVAADEVRVEHKPGAVLADSGDAAELDGNLTGLAQVLPVTALVELGGEAIALEVTRNAAEQALGLMYRADLADNRGMLFRFEPARPVQFWMKNVVIDLDMVFVNENKIVGIAADVPPCTTNPCPTYGPGFGVLVDQVIELRGGRAAELGLAIGDEVVIEPLNEPLIQPLSEP